MSVLRELLEYIGSGGVGGAVGGGRQEAASTSQQPTTELAKHQVYLRKLNFQERVSEEVKKALKPAFAAKTISKDQYKDIMRLVCWLLLLLFLLFGNSCPEAR